MNKKAMIKVLRYKAEHIKTKIRPEFFAEVADMLEQQPCEDAISRTQALSDYADWYGYGYRENTFYKLLKDMPSVTPKTECSCDQIKWERDMAIAQLKELGYGLGEKPRTAHWILLDECANGGYYCSECHKKVVKEGWSNTVKKIKFCPNCGKKIVESKKGEE